MFSIKTKFYKNTGSSGFRSLMTYYCSGKIKNRKVYLNPEEVSEHPFYGDGKPFSASISKASGNYNLNINTYLDSPANLYCNLGKFQKLILKWQFGQTWIQQTENIKWMIMAILAGIGAFLGVAKYLLKCD